MDFHSLSRRELQALCKRNKIPANITNIAMADSLTALDTVEGLEDILITEKTSNDSPARTETKNILPRTSCRASTRRKPITDEPQTTQISTRTRVTTRRAEDSAAPAADMICRKMENQLKEAETPAAKAAVSRRRTGLSSVREGYSTRRSTRLLEKQIMGMNLDDNDDGEIEKGDARVVEDQEKIEEWVVLGKQTEVEGVSEQKKTRDIQEKTDVSVEQPAVLLEDSLMDDKKEEDTVKVEQQEISEDLCESENHKNADISDEKPSVLVEDSLMDGEKVEDSVKVELHQISDALYELENHKNADISDEGPTVLLEDSLMDDEKVKDSVTAEQREISEVLHHKNAAIYHEEPALLPEDHFMDDKNEEDNKSEDQKISDAEVFNENKDMDESPATMKKDDEKCEDILEKSLGAEDKSMMSVEVEKGLDVKEESLDVKEIVADSTEKDDSGSEGADGEKCDQEISFSEINSWLAISESKIADHFEEKVGSNDEISKIKTIPGINKENSVKENFKNVKKAPTDMSMRQLKKMLKQLQISEKNTDTKEDDNVAKVGKARTALKPLSDNSITTGQRENGN